MSASDSRYFELKGKSGEQVVHELATQTFFADWCYLNPPRIDGNELCDLLIVFDQTAILWQVKTLKLHEDGHYSAKEVQKNLRQLSGARRQLLDLKGVENLQDARGGIDPFDAGNIKEIFLISVLIGEEENFYSPFTQVKELSVHVLNREALTILLNELDTIADFCDYLREKERFFASKTSLIIEGGEEEILALYLENERQLTKYAVNSVVLATEGSWKHYLNRPEVLRKKQEDQISYLWDRIIDYAHTSGGQYKTIIREMARYNRFMRRVFAKHYWDMQLQAGHCPDPERMLRRISPGPEITFSFLFVDESKDREVRKALLQAQCFVARHVMQQNTKVLGIATEKRLAAARSFDFCFMDMPVWGKEQQREAQRLQDELGIWTNYETYNGHEDEYPK